ncbi:MAG: 7-cyano-7-deazaguanine synthase QueC [Planctomycetaceae bacterium]|nr:7-cyano-7-deazaguanine synthase QueC [Planctomycetaceae bacterium]|tara:strand:- start:2083 stop:2778 length:696 start_codon:yes stop_codon:yes gene_type:complete
MAVNNNQKAVVLLSGGLDSSTVLAIAVSEGYEVTALSFRYGQNHAHETDQATKIAKKFGVGDHTIIDIDLSIFGNSALTGQFEVPKTINMAALSEDIPITYVPARNTIFLSYALAMAEVREASIVMLGVNALDYSGYPDCRPEYVESFEEMANLATKRAVEGNSLKIVAPLLHLTKAQIIARGMALGVDYSMTTSCYDPDISNRACGSCDACRLRLRGFQENKMIDPAEYQ